MVRRRRGIAVAVSVGVIAAATAAQAGGARAALAGAQPTTARFLVTEYFPVPEAWFKGAPVKAKGIPGKHAQDFLWAPTGLTMEFDGVLRDGTHVHFANDEGITWVNRQGAPTLPRPDGHWSHGMPVQRDVGWRNADGQPTVKLARGGWTRGRGVRYEPSPLRFAPGPSEPFLRYWHTAAVDPKVIPFGSRIYISRYRNAPNHGWFLAQDTGHTIIDHQIDLYVPPPATPRVSEQFAGKLTVRVYPPTTATLAQIKQQRHG